MAVRYYADYRAEVDERILLNHRGAERQHEAGASAGSACLRLLLDKMYPAAIAEQLRCRGHDVDAVPERADLRSLQDTDVFAAAHEERRAVVSENIGDFSGIADGVCRSKRSTLSRSHPAPPRQVPAATDA